MATTAVIAPAAKANAATAAETAYATPRRPDVTSVIAPPLPRPLPQRPMVVRGANRHPAAIRRGTVTARSVTIPVVGAVDPFRYDAGTPWLNLLATLGNRFSPAPVERLPT